MSDLRDRLRKLLALARDSDSAESQTAQRLYENLLAGSGLTAADVDDEAVDVHRLHIPPGTRVILSAICASLGVDWGFVQEPVPRRGKSRKIRWLRIPAVRCTRRQAEVICEMHNFSSAVYLRKKRQAQAEVRGYLAGHLHGMYPTEKRPPECPKCKARKMGWSGRDRRWICLACGYRGPQLEPVDMDAYLQGVREAARPVLGAPQPSQLDLRL